MRFTLFVDLEPRGGSDDGKKTGVYKVFVFATDGMVLIYKKKILKKTVKKLNIEEREVEQFTVTCPTTCDA